jgi:CheY-like chemotaxis protein
MQQIRILIVDDEKPLMETLGQILRNAGYMCQAASSGELALEHVRSFNPALLITDVMMTGMNGVDLARAVRDSHPDCAVLLYTGTVGATRNLLETGGNGHGLRILAKPLQPMELLTIVAQTLGNHATQEDQPSTAPLSWQTAPGSNVQASEPWL